jgi:hypothetical protein
MLLDALDTYYFLGFKLLVVPTFSKCIHFITYISNCVAQ